MPDQSICRQYCLDEDLWYFSQSITDTGKCCDPKAAQAADSTCNLGGYSSIVAQEHMKYFLCPQGFQCGPDRIIAETGSRTYTIDSSALAESENICNHMISFPIDAGVNDILKIKFLAHNPGTVVNLSVGTSFASSRGEVLTDLTDKLLRVGFPNSIFLSIEHRVKPSGRLSLEFWYLD